MYHNRKVKILFLLTIVFAIIYWVNSCPGNSEHDKGAYIPKSVVQDTTTPAISSAKTMKIVSRDPNDQEIAEYCKENPRCVKEKPVIQWKTRDPNDQEIAEYCKENPRCVKEKPVIQWKTRDPNDQDIVKYCKENPTMCQNPAVMSAAPQVIHETTNEGCALGVQLIVAVNAVVTQATRWYPRIQGSLPKTVKKVEEKSKNGVVRLDCVIPGEDVLLMIQGKDNDLLQVQNNKAVILTEYTVLLQNSIKKQLEGKPVVFNGKAYLMVSIPK